VSHFFSESIARWPRTRLYNHPAANTGANGDPLDDVRNLRGPLGLFSLGPITVGIHDPYLVYMIVSV